MRKQALRMNMMRMHSMRLPSNALSLLASASNSEAEDEVNDNAAANRESRSQSPKKSELEEKKAPRQLAGRKKKKRAARAAGQPPPPPPDEAPITPMKKSSRSKSVPAVSREVGAAPASPHTPSKQHKLRMQQGLVPAPPPPPPLMSKGDDEKVSPKPVKANVSSKLAGAKEKRKSKKPASSDDALASGDGEKVRSVNKTRSATAGTRSTAAPVRRDRGTRPRPPPPTNSNKRQLSTRTLSTASRTSSGKSEASVAGASPTSNTKSLTKPVRRSRSRDDETKTTTGAPDAAPNPSRRRNRKSTSPIRRVQGTKAPVTPRALPRKMASLDSQNKSTKKFSPAANTRSVPTQSKSGGLPARSLSNNSETAGRAGGALKKKGVFGSMRSLIKSPKQKPSKEKAPAPMVEEVMEVDIM